MGIFISAGNETGSRACRRTCSPWISSGDCREGGIPMCPADTFGFAAGYSAGDRFAKCTVTYNKQCAVQTGFLVIRFVYQ